MKYSVKNLVVEKAKELLFSYSAESITMNLVAKELDITAPTLYHYFKGKDEMLNAAGELIKSELISLLDVKFPSSVPFEVRVLTAAHSIADYFFSSKLPVTYLLEDPGDKPVNLEEFREKFISLFKDYMKEGSSKGNLKSPEAAALRFLGVMVSDIVYYRSQNKALPEDFADAVLSFCFNKK